MPALILWKDQEMQRLRKDMDRLIDRLWDDFGRWDRPKEALGGGPTLYLSETEDTLVLQGELTGIDPGDLDVSIAQDVITVKGRVLEHGVSEGAGFTTVESKSRFFSRSLRLPCKVLIDEAQATFKDNLLRIVLPKYKEEFTRKVRIRIQ